MLSIFFYLLCIKGHCLQALLDQRALEGNHDLVQLLIFWIKVMTSRFRPNKSLLQQFPSIMTKLIQLRAISKEAYNHLYYPQDKSSTIPGIVPVTERTARKVLIPHAHPGINSTALDLFLQTLAVMVSLLNLL